MALIEVTGHLMDVVQLPNFPLSQTSHLLPTFKAETSSKYKLVLDSSFVVQHSTTGVTNTSQLQGRGNIQTLAFHCPNTCIIFVKSIRKCMAALKLL